MLNTCFLVDVSNKKEEKEIINKQCIVFPCEKIPLYWYRVSTHQKHTTKANVHTLQTHPICFVFYTYYKYSYEFQARESHFFHQKKLSLKSNTNPGKCYHTNLGFENWVTPGKKSERWWAGGRGGMQARFDAVVPSTIFLFLSITSTFDFLHFRFNAIQWQWQSP